MKKRLISIYGIGLMLAFLLTGCLSEKAEINNEIPGETEEIIYSDNEGNINNSLLLTENNYKGKAEIKIFYKTNFIKTFAYYKAMKTWTSLPGIEMVDSTNKPGYKELIVTGSSIALMVNDGDNNWDSIGKKRAMYKINGKGEYIIEEHRIKKIKEPKSKYESMAIKGEFSQNQPLQMKLISNYTWEGIIYGNTTFVFDVYGDGKIIFGDSDSNGTAEINGKEISVDNNKYKVTFNEKTKEYTIEKIEILPAVINEFSAISDENNNVTINISSPMPEKPDGVKIYKSTTKSGNYKLICDIKYDAPKWQEENSVIKLPNEIGNEDGFAYYMAKSYVGLVESGPSNIIELKVGKYHNPLSKIENFKAELINNNVNLSWSYFHIIKPDGLRIYKGLSREGEYKILKEIKFEQNSQLMIGGAIMMKETGNENGFVYYYAVPFIGVEEGEKTDIIELKVR